MKYSILYLDDNEQMLRLFGRMFGQEYDVRTAGRAEDAFRLLEERHADIVISDQRMPEMEGTEFLRRVSELHPKSFRMLLTGHATVAGTLSELSSGVVQQFIPKPWEAATMREALTRAQPAVRGRAD
jgi:DNA-binding NtrC family response regulator